MMSHYGLPYEYDDNWISGALELSIETLTGTAFEIRVSPNDTIMSIKSKIQSVEGIPISQQHLLYNLEELDNSASVRDYSIQNGATLKLVLSMRGGPISTKRLPPVDEMAWRELQELMSDSRRDDLFERLPSGSRVTVLVFRDGDQVNLLRVIENEDGSFSPLSESWNGTSIRNLFAEEDPEESAKRLKENSVTMGKMQELKEKLESLSLQRREKKNEDAAASTSGAAATTVTTMHTVPSEKIKTAQSNDSKDSKPLINFQSGDSNQLNNTKSIRRTELEDPDSYRYRRRLVSCSRTTTNGLSKAWKDAENIIRMQSKLSVFVDSESGNGFSLKRAPLPDIRRSPRPEKEEKKTENVDLDNNMREKTSTRKTFAILEEENDLSSPPSICSSQNSIVALPSNEQVAIAYSPIPRERVSTTLSRSYRVSRYVLDNDAERPKTTPGKLDNREPSSPSTNRQFCNLVTETDNRKRTNHILSTISNLLPKSSSKSQVEVLETDDKNLEPTRTPPKKRASNNLRNPSFREEVVIPLPANKLPPVKKRLRCSQCKKKLNITNTYTCRCGGMYCSIHRYSEVHNCLFDYKEEGRKLLQQSNPLVAASKLPKI